MLLWAALTVCFITALIAVLMVLQLNKRLQQSQQTAVSDIKALKHELDVVSRAAIGVGQRLMSVEKKFNVSLEKQQQLENSHPDYQPYNYAASLAEGGASAEQLVDRLGLPEAEASLLALLKNHVADDERRLES